MVFVSFKEGIIKRRIEGVEEFKERNFDELRVRMEDIQR